MNGPMYEHEVAYQRIRDAAPVMLEALQAYVDAYDNATGTIHVNDKIRAAIAKALGQEGGAL